jgi:hypothetical protein
LPRFRHDIYEEASEFCEFARGLKARTETCRDVFDRPIDDMNSALRRGRSPVDAEAALEACGRALRWLDSSSFRRQSKLSFSDSRADQADRNWIVDKLRL